jgi:RNA polymerase sigma-70 factor (ECF subfamily)
MAENKAGFDIAQLVAANYQAVYRYAYRLCGSVADAEDLTQKVFLTAQGNMGQLRNIDSSRSWLFTILRNCFLRDRQRQRPIIESNLSFNIDHISFEAQKDKEIDPEQLQAALDEIPELSRLILVMFYFEERSYREIAQELDLPLGTVMSRLARAKVRLRTKLFPSNPPSRKRRPRITLQGRGDI